MIARGKKDRGVVEIVDTESLVPPDHMLRKVDRAVDWEKLYEMVEPLYSADEGRPSVDPIVLFKIVLLQHLYGISSMRRTMAEIEMNIGYRWFLGYTLSEGVPHFSTVSYNFRQRNGTGMNCWRRSTRIGRHTGRSSSTMMTIHPSLLERSGTTPQRRSWPGGKRRASRR